MDNYKYAVIKDKISFCDNVKIYGELDGRINPNPHNPKHPSNG